MSDSREPDNIDLTEDQEDLLETLLESKNDEAKNRNSLKNSKFEGASSVIEELESIPQIETIFLDSDEEDEKQELEPAVKIHDVQTIHPRYTFLSPPASTLANKIPPSSLNSQFSTIIKNSPFRVREISPSLLTSNIVRNANTIALPDNTHSASPKRFLIIPNDVLPVLQTSKGPISLNVPGIGSLLIPKPFEMLKTPYTPTSGNSKLAVNSVPAKSEVVVEKDTPKPYDALSDPKYQCWKYRKTIKRDLEGYSLSERLGFYQAEQRRSRLCARRCTDNVKRLEFSIDILKRKLKTIPKLNVANVKLVEIDKIKKGGSRKRTPQKLSIKPKPKTLNPVQQKNLEILMSWKEHFKAPQPISSTDSDSSQAANDLLVTKRVVVLNNGRKRKYRKKQDLDIKQEVHNSEPETRKKKKKLGRPRKIVKPKEEPDETVISTISKRGRPRKSKLFDSVKPRKYRTKKAEMITQIKKEDYKVKPCRVEIPRLKLLKETVEEYRAYYANSKVINNLKQLQNKINPSKPMLVINEPQSKGLNLKQLCSKNNVVFPVSESTPLSLISSMEESNVLFVKFDIFCQYISGARDTN